MASNLCPRCDSELERRYAGTGSVSVCPEGHGVFLERIELGNLVESETDWHRNASQHTAPMPRITADMTAPPPSRPRARSYIETLF